jgi:hypothetical protein
MKSCIYKIIFISIVLIGLAGCSIPEFYLDIHYPQSISLNEPFPIDVFITNSRPGTIVHIESIQLTGELAQYSQLMQGRNGLYNKSESSDIFFAEPNRRLTQFETGAFSVTLKPLKAGSLQGTFIFVVNGMQESQDITVEVK